MSKHLALLVVVLFASSAWAQTDTPTPTETPVPATATITRTPYSAGDAFIDDYAAFTATQTKTITQTPTITPSPTVTPTPTVHGCGQVTLTGFMFNADGSAAVNRRITIQIPRTEVVNEGCTLHPSIVTYKTTATGAVPAGASVVAGSTLQITLENGTPVCVNPPHAASVDLNQLLTTYQCRFQ